MPKTDVTFWLEGEPVAKARPRWSRGKIYTPSKTTKAENEIRKAYKEADGQEILGPVCVSMTFCLQTPKNWSKAKKGLAQLLELLPTKRPDLDNLVKTVFDALNGLAYEDDKQICELHAYKTYNETPRTCVRVREI